MILDGIKCRKTRQYGWRYGDPARDVDSHGNPVKSNYIVIVRLRDCPVLEKQGHRFYDPKDAPQAFKLGYGGTHYGYGSPKAVRNGTGRHIVVQRKSGRVYEWFCSYIKTPVYFVSNGQVYIGNCYREMEKAA